MRKLALVSFLLFYPSFAMARNGTVLVIDKIAPKNEAFIGVVDSSQTLNNTSNFDHNLSTNDITVQQALDTLDNMTGGSGTPGGLDKQFQYNTTGTFSGSALLTHSTTYQINLNSISSTTYSSVNSMTFGDGVLLDMSQVNMSTNTEGFRLPQSTDCSSSTLEGQACWDTDNDLLYIGGSAPNYLIPNRSTLTPGATVYVSSGNIAGQLSVQSLKFSDGTILTSSPTINVTFAFTQSVSSPSLYCVNNDSLCISTITNSVVMQNGTVSNPSWRFLGQNTGAFLPANGVMAFTVNASTIITVQSSQVRMEPGKQFAFDSGSAASPGFIFSGDSGGNSGVYYLGNSAYAFVSNGVQRMRVRNTGAYVTIGNPSDTTVSALGLYNYTETGVNTATLTNSPRSGNPATWIGIEVNDQLRYIPVW